MNILVVGLDKQNLHLILDINSILILKPAIHSVEDTFDEYCLEARLLRDGMEAIKVGFVAREFLKSKHIIENKMARITCIYKDSLNQYELKISKERSGVCLCQIIN